MVELVDHRGRPLNGHQADDLVEREYKAAQPSHMWTAPPAQGSGNAAIEKARAKLRDWGRSLEENHDLTAQMIRLRARAMSRQTLIPMPRRRSGAPFEELRRRLAELWREWTRQSDAMELNPWGRHCELIASSMLRDGDMFVRHFLGDVRRGRRVHYSFASYEADFVPFDVMTIDQAVGRVVHGIELDAAGRPVRAWFYPTHPGDVDQYAEGDLIPVEWAELTHLKHARRLGQYRGASALSPALVRLVNIDDYEGSEQFAAKVAGAVAVQLIRSPETPVDTGDVDTTIGARTRSLQPGMMLDDLLPGERWEVVDTSRPNPELSNYRKSQLQAATAGFGVSYSETTNDYSGTYSSQRQELVTTRQWYRDDQEYWRETFLRDVYGYFVQAVILQAPELRVASLLAQADPMSLEDFDTIPDATPQIDVQKEAGGEKVQLETKTESRHGIMRKRGVDPQRVDEEIAADAVPALDQVSEPGPEGEEETDTETENDE